MNLVIKQTGHTAKLRVLIEFASQSFDTSFLIASVN